MAFAPLDVWASLLIDARGRIPPRYWLRLAWALVGSACGTLLTLPERLLLAPVLALRPPRLDHHPGVVIVVGYYRSGTTHLHNLMSCLPGRTAPRWNQALAPHGWWLAWTLLRAALIPFLPNTRPQDDVPFGPDWPAEDDFAACNLALASSLPGRLVVPRRADHYARFHDLARLAPRELARWRRATAGFLWKLTRPGARAGRVLVLKTPSHTARLNELARLLGPERVRFIHVSREPVAVVRSNLALHHRLAGFLLQDPPKETELRERIIDEFARTERAFLEQSAVCGARVARIRYQDLVADPLAELVRAHVELDLPWTDEHRARAEAYLRALGDYRAAQTSPAPSAAAAPGDADWTRDPRLVELRERFDHDCAPRATAPRIGSPDAGGRPRSTPAKAALVLLATALAVGGLWVALAWLTRDRWDILAWPAGLVLGLSALRACRTGSTGLGVAAAATAAGLGLGVAWPATYLAYSHAWLTPVQDTWIAVRDLLSTFGNHVLFWGLGGLSAFRAASRRHPTPPGLL